jgi:hypothetical protein
MQMTIEVMRQSLVVLEGYIDLAQRNELVSRVAELEKDAARLDHLAKAARVSSLSIDGDHTWNFLWGSGWKAGATFREAIDAAM